MQISKILYNNRVNFKNISFKGAEKTQSPAELNQIGTENALKAYYGREMVNQPDDGFEETIKNNWFKLPEGCEPDSFQIESAKALYEGYDVLSSAPTGTGKTAIAHYAVSKNMSGGRKTFYTTPIKALSNQKLNEFRKVYGEENVGILTGDRRENAGAPIIIMTTEVYRNMVLSNMYGEENPLLDNLGTVIFDEFHYMDDKGRGSAWEESAMLTPDNVQKLALSATMGNLDELNGWFNELSSSKSELVSIPESKRHVPLEYFSIPTGSFKEEEKRIKKSIKRTGEIQNSALSSDISKPVLSDFKFVINKLNKKSQLPAIIFVFSRNYSKELLEYLAEEGPDLTTQEEKENINKIVNEHKSKKYIGSDLNMEALKKGYAVHNAGIIPSQKELIEELFQKKLIKSVIATETLAAGINMPAKTVVISSPYKPSEEEDEEKSRLLTPNEFKQMAGRAGRRGIDTEGYVYTMPANQERKEEFSVLEHADSNPIYSRYNPDYAFLAGYIEHNEDLKNLSELYDKSFYVYGGSYDEDMKNARISALLTSSEQKIHLMLHRGLMTKDNGRLSLTDTGYMASKVKGYDTITLAETIKSKAFDKISPEALAMVAAGLANPAAKRDVSVGIGKTDFRVFDSFQNNTDNVYNRLYAGVNKQLGRLGKNINSFASYDEIIQFVESIERPDIPIDELNIRFSQLKEKMDKLDIIKSKEKYSQERLISDLRDGKTIPERVLNEYSMKVNDYKASLKEDSIDEHIEQLEADIASLAEHKGKKSKLLYEKKCEEIQNKIEQAQEMQYLDERLEREIINNKRFIKENKTLKKDYADCERLRIQSKSPDVLLSMVKGLKSIDEYQFDNDLTAENISNYLKVSSCFNELLTRNASICSDEEQIGLKSSPASYNQGAAEHVYNWAMLNRINSDSMSNWKQVLNVSRSSEEGVIYREILQTADLLSQIGEMAQAGYEKADNEADLKYFIQLKNTAMLARRLLINEPVTV